MDGYEVADRLGLDAVGHMCGDDGGAYLLRDDRILKVTGSSVDACVALAIRDVARPPGVPLFESVHRFVEMVEVPGHGDWPLTMYALVREGMEHLDCQNDPGWRSALWCLNHGWYDDDQAMMDRAADYWTGPELPMLRRNLEWYRDVTGVKLFDVRAPNVGMTEDGGIGMRDLGRGAVPERLVTALSDVPELPDAPAPGPA